MCMCMCVGFEKNSLKALFDWVCEGFEKDVKICLLNKTVHLKKLNGFIPKIVRGFESSKE